MPDPQIHLDDDADLSAVQERNAAVLGYGVSARAHALCLRDAGVDVRVGLEGDTAPYWNAIDDGLRAVAPYEACEEADLVVVADPVPDAGVVADILLPNLVAGDAVVLGPDAAPVAGLPSDVDVFRVAPWAGGARLRSEYEAGRGVPMFVAVLADGSGDAWRLALGYARAVGGTRAGVLRVAESELAHARAAADRMLAGDLLPLFRRTVEDLTESGCPAVVAYVQCVRGVERFSRSVAEEAPTALLQQPPTAETPSAAADPLRAAAALVASLAGRRAGGGPGLH